MSQLIQRAVVLFAGVSFLAISGEAAAQAQVAKAGEAEASAEGIVVTGTRIVRNGDSSPVPITVISAQETLRVQPGTLADALNVLPVFSGSRGAASNPSAAGASGAGNGSANQINLRNVGPQRNLILLDGMRIPPTTFTNIVDVDIVPQMLIKRVDVVTGGVSAVYGSDAVTGVVNYIIDRNFNGILLQAEGGISTRSDALKYSFGGAFGTKFADDRGHIEASIEYRNEEGILRRSERDWLNLVGVTGSGTVAAPYQVQSNIRQTGFPLGGLIVAGGPNAGQVFGPSGTLHAFQHGTATSVAAQEIGGEGGYYDSSLLAPLRSLQGAVRLDYEVSDNVRFYAQFLGNDKTNENYQDNPVLSRVTMSGQNGFLLPQYRFGAGGTAAADTFTFSQIMTGVERLHMTAKSRQWMASTGLEGKLGNFNWKAGYVHGETVLKTTLANNINNQRLAAALDAVLVGSNVVCRASTLSASYSNCVPINVLGEGNVSKAAIDYITGDTHLEAKTTTDDLAAEISGPAFSLPAGPVNVALSAEWRKMSFIQNSDASIADFADCTNLRFNCAASGTTRSVLWVNTFARGPKVSQSVKEAAFEIDVPVIRDAPMIGELNLNGAVRYTSYDTSGDYTTWKVGADWKVNDWMRLRGTISRDIRAPTLYDLFAPTNASLVRLTDNLTGQQPTVTSTDQSNPNLTAEKARTITAGIVLKPVPALSIAIDYYRIKLSDAIVIVNGATAAVQNACYASSGTSPYCLLQTRPGSYTDTSAANAVTGWSQRPVNLAEIETHGFDVEVNWATRIANRPFSLRVLTAFQPHIYYRQPGLTTTDQGNAAFGPAGMGGAPGVRVTAMLHFEPTDNFRIDLMQRWRSSMKLAGDPTLVWVNDRLPAFATTNLTLTYAPQLGGAKPEFYLNVQNLFDANPPIGGYYANGARAGGRDGFSVGDTPLGRYFTLGARVKF